MKSTQHSSRIAFPCQDEVEKVGSDDEALGYNNEKAREYSYSSTLLYEYEYEYSTAA